MEAKKAFLMFLLFGALSLNTLVHDKQPHRKVLILGAGLSGIIAGKTLQDSGIDDFLILEGQDYIGGRIKQAPFSGYNVEKGANWIQDAKDEETAPIWKLKQAKTMRGIYSDYYDMTIRNETGANVTGMASNKEFEKMFSTAKQKIEELTKKNPTISARAGLSLLGWNPHTPAQYAIEFYNIDFEYGKKAELIPISSLSEIGMTSGEDFFVTDERGMWTLYEDLYKGFDSKIKLNKTVTGIKYNSSGVEVTTRDGEVYTADYVLCTFSTGVLASDMVKFTPPLPEWKQEAILKMPMSVYTKIFLKFPDKFWDNKEYILLAGHRRGFFPVFQDLERPAIFPNGSGMLMITVTGDEGRRIEKQSFQETKTEIVKMLRGVYGQNVSEPTDIFYARWSLNPYVRGAFSAGTVGISSKDVTNLDKNVGNLYFSGEATSGEWNGYMQGAYFTGEEKAKSITKAIKCQDTGVECPKVGSSMRLDTTINAILAAFLAGWLVQH